MHTTLEAIFEMTFATTTGMHLRLDHQLRAGEFLSSSSGFFRCRCDSPFRAGHLETIEKLFGLVFVNVHRDG